VTRYEDVHAVLADPFSFSSRDGIVVGLKALPEEASWSVLNTDPPRHAALRNVITHNFTPRAISRPEDSVRRIASTCLNVVAEKQYVDFVSDVAHPIPAAIALSLLGVPEEDWGRLAELEHITVAIFDPDFVPEGQDREVAVKAALQELKAYFTALMDSRRANPGDDLISQLLEGVVEAEPLTSEYIVVEANKLMNGGLDTTRAAASAGGMLPLLERPDVLIRLQAEPALVHTAVEEFIRWASPITHVARTVRAPTVIRDVPLHGGGRVVIFPASANRDDAQFFEPFRYDITGVPDKHIGFGFGEHYCLGVQLARLTLRILFEEIVTRFKTVELTADPARFRSNFVGGLKRLPVHMVPA
jgi:cytochrome P450